MVRIKSDPMERLARAIGIDSVPLRIKNSMPQRMGKITKSAIKLAGDGTSGGVDGRARHRVGGARPVTFLPGLPGLTQVRACLSPASA